MAVLSCFGNSGQSCNAPTRLLVPAKYNEQVIEIAKKIAAGLISGDPRASNTNLGPVVSKAQFDKIQYYIQKGIEQGADLIIGGIGRPDNLSRGFYVKPTIFANVKANMDIARDEIFGPVLSIMTYNDIDEAIAIANDSNYGLAAYVQSTDLEKARNIARKLRVGNVTINRQPWDMSVPFGGYKHSGNGRECGKWGISEFLEIKAIIGYGY